MIDVMLITFMIEMKVDQPKPPEGELLALHFFCVFMVNDMNYRFNAMTLAELLSMPGIVRPIGAPIYVGSHTIYF